MFKLFPIRKKEFMFMLEYENKPKLKLMGFDGNVPALLLAAENAWKKSNQPLATWKNIKKEMLSEDYGNMLRVTLKYFHVC